jgi:lipopolysaccharide/colanic/teichoic acid biosynthesis glycosyltransferase
VSWYTSGSQRARYLRVKRGLDLFLCVLAAPMIVLLLAICYVAVRLDSPGPALFTQNRVGLHGRSFRMYKFRTMVENAEELKASLAHLNVLPPPDFKIIDDPRITRVGRFLRKTSLDELPQLINIIRGEMSLVGPRPTDFGIDRYDLWHCERLEVPPGLTGLWQVEGRNVANFDERLRMDIAYIDGMSLRTDLGLILRTFAIVVRGTGA